MRDLNEHNITAAVLASLEDCEDARFVGVMRKLVSAVHDFMRDARITEAEWMAGIQYLTRVGQECSGSRQEFILLSDTMGVSTLMDALNHAVPAGATESAVLGPFHLPGAPEIEQGENIMRTEMEGSVSVLVEGRVIDLDGNPIAGAKLDLWQTAPNSLYEDADPSQPAFNLRGILRSGDDGRYSFRTVRPTYYPIPMDGPVGDLLRKLNRHPNRPAHIHLIASAPGYHNVTTQVFDIEDPYIDSDATFSVRSSIVARFEPHEAEGLRLDYDVVLTRADAT